MTGSEQQLQGRALAGYHAAMIYAEAVQHAISMLTEPLEQSIEAAQHVSNVRNHLELAMELAAPAIDRAGRR